MDSEKQLKRPVRGQRMLAIWPETRVVLDSIRAITGRSYSDIADAAIRSYLGQICEAETETDKKK